MSVAIAVTTDDSVAFMCGGNGEVFQNITKLGRKKLKNSVKHRYVYVSSSDVQ
jgi:hypothetical protein